jgi:hypothetical protein
MTTVTTDQLTDTIQQLKEATEAALSQPGVSQFEALEKYLNEVDGFVRETQQAMWAAEARMTVRRLENGEPLNAQDHDVIRAFLISDAEHYVAIENDYNNWLSELKRLIKELDRRAKNVDRFSIADLRGILKDAIRLVPDIRNFLDEQQRISKFENASKQLDQTSRSMLCKLLNEQLRTANR